MESWKIRNYLNIDGAEYRTILQKSWDSGKGSPFSKAFSFRWKYKCLDVPVKVQKIFGKIKPDNFNLLLQRDNYLALKKLIETHPKIPASVITAKADCTVLTLGTWIKIHGKFLKSIFKKNNIENYQAYSVSTVARTLCLHVKQKVTDSIWSPPSLVSWSFLMFT